MSTSLREFGSGYIDRAEKEVLLYAFGREMYEDFLSAMSDAPGEPLPLPYINILDGVMYEVDGDKRYWMGLRNNITKESLLADYTYYLYFNENVTLTTEAGEVLVETKVGTRASMTRKIVKAYNQFIARFHGGVRSNADGWTIEGDPYWLIGNKGVDYYGIYGKRGDVSLVQFLFDNKADYPLLDTRANRFGSEIKNEFGI